jgi:hypothetical protein
MTAGAPSTGVAIYFAARDKMDLAVNIAIGSSAQMRCSPRLMPRRRSPSSPGRCRG